MVLVFSAVSIRLIPGVSPQVKFYIIPCSVWEILIILVVRETVFSFGKDEIRTKKYITKPKGAHKWQK